jgi:adenosylhomocysteine nucleosidase
MSNPRPLICFAVKEEAAVFRRTPAAARVDILLTGMGKANAAQSIRAALAAKRPALVISSGCAGGLNPQLLTGDVVFDCEVRSQKSEVRSQLLAAGAREGKFHFADRVATTAEEKWALWHATQADAVEMESQIIRDICREQNIPSATVRVILDQAGEDLPLDFNALMTPDMRLDGGKLARTILKSPGKIGSLLRLQRQTKLAATKLAEVLAKLV